MPLRLRAFSLVEMMIAIIILGLGLVMVATIFPVAWDRARTLSEYTVEQSAAAGAQATLAALLRPAGHSLVRRLSPLTTPPYEELRLTSGSLAGDMFFDPTMVPPPGFEDQWYKAVLAYSDTSVHALNVDNILLISTGAAVPTVAENPWDLEDPGGSFPTPPPTRIVLDRFRDADYPDPDYQRNRGRSFPDGLFYHTQVRVWQRLYPPLEAPPTATGPELDQWNEKLATRRFCWAVLHRLRSSVGPAPFAFGAIVSQADSDRMVREAAAAMGSTRNFDMYYVTLRRPRSTNRYASQDPAPARIPNPFSFVRPVQVVQPATLPSDQDVMFPVAWRVQMEFPATLSLAANRTGVPTEILFPHNDVSDEPSRMLVQMFPVGTQFIDEITGNIYRVAKRRIIDDEGRRSVLTLDREIVLEDVDIPLPDPRCEFCTTINPSAPAADPEELLRTVWVFPPPVDSADRLQFPDNPTPQFDGPSPVVDIEVGALSISPSS